MEALWTRRCSETVPPSCEGASSLMKVSKSSSKTIPPQAKRRGGGRPPYCSGLVTILPPDCPSVWRLHRDERRSWEAVIGMGSLRIYGKRACPDNTPAPPQPWRRLLIMGFLVTRGKRARPDNTAPPAPAPLMKRYRGRPDKLLFIGIRVAGVPGWAQW